MSRAERRSRTRRKVLQRQRLLDDLDVDLGRPPGAWASRHPFDCGRSQCGVCHWRKNEAAEKRLRIERQARIEWIAA